MKYLLPLALSSLVLLSSASCGGSKSQAQETTEEQAPTPARTPAPFDTDSTYQYIQDQLAFGIRTPGSPGHKACREWIAEKLHSWGYIVQEQHFPGKDYAGKAVTGTNLIATRSWHTGNRLLLMAHWDTRPVADQDPQVSSQDKPIPGADDGASGVAVLLELARQESLKPSGKALDFVFFDLEDGGNSGDEASWCQGSQYFAKNPPAAGYKPSWGILLDMVGAKDARFYWEGLSKAYARPLLSTLWQVAGELGWGQYFIQADGGTMTDDHVPIIQELGTPSVDIINYDPTRPTGFGTHWHTHADALTIISKETLTAVGQTVATVLRDEL